MQMFQIESNKVQPTQGSILIASPFIGDYHFAHAVVLLVDYSDEGAMGITLNKNFRYQVTLNEMVPELALAPRIPVYKGGPVERNILFFVHTLKEIKDSLPLGNGLYVNGDFNQVQQYILDGRPTEGVIRFYAGYAGWTPGQLMDEIEGNSWMTGKLDRDMIFGMHTKDLWQTSLDRMGGRYAIWSRYPMFPTLN